VLRLLELFFGNEIPATIAIAALIEALVSPHAPKFPPEIFLSKVKIIAAGVPVSGKH
jgi:hypothetical protein